MFGSNQASGTGFSFGTPAAPSVTTSAASGSTGFSFSSLTSTAPFGGTQNTATSTANTGFGFGTGGFGATNSTTTGFGTSNTGFGATTQQQQQPSLSGFSGPATSYAMPQPTLTLTLNTTTSAPSAPTATKTVTLAGLGGTPLPANNGKSNDTADKSKSYRDTLVPPEFMPLVENMKKFLEKQKQIRDENSHEHIYFDPIQEIGRTIEEVLRVRLNKVDIEIQKNSKAIEMLKKDTNRLLSNGELVYRISRLDFPLSSTAEVIAQNSFINANTHQYFMELVDGFKRQMAEYSQQIQTLKSYCATSANDKSSLISCDEINQIIRRQHENFVALASKVYAVHEYANKLRVQAARDNAIAERESAEDHAKSSAASKQHNQHYGPSPFAYQRTPQINTFITPQAVNPNNTQATNQSYQLFGGGGGVASNPSGLNSSSSYFSSPSTSASTSFNKLKRF